MAEEREALYALALGSTLSGGRKELAGVAGVAVTLARVSAVAACLDEMRWATLALGCALMVSERVCVCVRACVRVCVCERECVYVCKYSGAWVCPHVECVAERGV